MVEFELNFDKGVKVGRKQMLKWLEKKMDELNKQFYNDKYNQYDAERGFDYLLEAAKKEASKQ